MVVVTVNLAVQRWEVVSVGFGLMAPAGIYFCRLGVFHKRCVTRNL
ncbi:uncharacterized protein METZ01_LOCUS104960 [marine metagenome]|uniref:Uncharacterized protein n=1 Tax=marine metagenome TaxID=408172 RepID=A0A381WHW5_9ZZZZ